MMCGFALACGSRTVAPAGDSSTGASSTTDPAPEGGSETAAMEELCAMQSSREACDAVPVSGSGTALSWCAWETWVEASIDDAGACSFGAIERRCAVNGGGDACGGPIIHCTSNVSGSWDGQRLGTSTRWCYPPFTACSPDEGPDVCACLCDPGFPAIE